MKATNVFDIDKEFMRKQRIIIGLEPCQYVDAFKVLRTRVLHKMRESGWNALAVTSVNSKAGATLSAINLAISLALEIDQAVLLVDANLRNPGVHAYFGIDPMYGLADFLLDDASLNNIIPRPQGLDRLMLIPGSRPLSQSAELLSSPQMNVLVKSLKNHDVSRLIVYDLPHVQTADALALLPLVDAALLVVEAGVTTQAELTQAMEHLNGIHLIGTLLNKSEVSN